MVDDRVPTVRQPEDRTRGDRDTTRHQSEMDVIAVTNISKNGRTTNV